jgi:hypothetical protein
MSIQRALRCVCKSVLSLHSQLIKPGLFTALPAAVDMKANTHVEPAITKSGSLMNGGSSLYTGATALYATPEPTVAAEACERTRNKCSVSQRLQSDATAPLYYTAALTKYYRMKPYTAPQAAASACCCR